MASQDWTPGRRDHEIVDNIGAADFSSTFPRGQQEAMAPERAAMKALLSSPAESRLMWWSTYRGLRTMRETLMRSAIKGER